MNRKLDKLGGYVVPEFAAGKLSAAEIEGICNDTALMVNVQRLKADIPSPLVKENRIVDENPPINMDEVLFEMGLILKLRGWDPGRLAFNNWVSDAESLPLELTLIYDFKDNWRQLFLEYNVKHKIRYEDGEMRNMCPRTAIWGYMRAKGKSLGMGYLQSEFLEGTWNYSLEGEIVGS